MVTDQKADLGRRNRLNIVGLGARELLYNALETRQANFGKSACTNIE